MRRNYLFLLALIPLVSWSQGRDRLSSGDSPSSPRREYCRRTPAVALDDSLHRFDVLSISCSLQFNLDAPGLAGSATLRLVADELPLTQIDLRLIEELQIDSIVSSTHAADSMGRSGLDSLQIFVSPQLQVGDTCEITIFYHGTPAVIDDWGGMRFHQASGWRPQICYSMGDGLDLDPPPANYNWLPSFADPADKVTWECWLRVPETRVAVSGGVRGDTLNHGDGTTTWHYVLSQPVSTYLIFVSISEYQIYTQRESNPLIEHFVYPSRWTQAQVHYEPVPAALDAFVELFGAYPFGRFGYNMTRIGDMEHATCVSHYDAAVVSNRTYDWLLFHEMSHMWWGDWVTIGDWRDLWLNEGFATYCEALAMEQVYGEQAFQDYVRTDLQPTARSASTQYSIYDPNDYWSSVVYEKGACVMHMLRWVMGDSLFFEALRDYGQQYAFSNAVTTDFQEVCEAHYDSTLQWFFDEWVYTGRGYPRYALTFNFGHVNNLEIEQVQNVNLYSMPAEIRYLLDGEVVSSDTIWISEAYTQLNLNIDPWVDSVSFDPNGWLLKTSTYSITPADETPNFPSEFRLLSTYPNPFNPELTIEYESPRAERVTMTIFDITGAQVERIETMSSAGANQLHWNASDHASGIYLIQLNTTLKTCTAKAVYLK